MRFQPVLIAALVAPLALSACNKSKKGDKTTDGFTGPQVTEPTGDTSPPVVQLKIVNEVRFRAFIAWDPVAGQIVPPTIDGSSTSSRRT